MADTLLLLIFLIGFIIYLVYILIRRNKFTNKRIIISILVGSGFLIFFFMFTGLSKVKSDLSRLIHNSSPKKAEEVYNLLFKKPIDSCVVFINFNDQVIPKIDCCIWMEVKLCPSELNRVINLKRYQENRFNKKDSLNFLKPFGDRPAWWIPQSLGDSLTALNIKFNKDNEQTLFFGKDSSHVYICDQAL